ncbi:MAG: hypothetical protein A3J83_03090, partial [Elusimicrobia bacterium RIFOXYA2_FULL_40_6]
MPNFERVKESLFCRQPDRVPQFEGWVDQEVKDVFMGKKVSGLKSEVEFWEKAGYDFINLHINIARPIDEAYKTRTSSDVGSSYGETAQRQWASEHDGVLSTREKMNAIKWPTLKDYKLEQFEEVKKYLPKGMKIIGGTSGFFEHTWQMMGFETFSFALVDDPSFVEEIIGRFSELSISVMKEVVKHEEVQALWYCDDVAFCSGLMFSKNLLMKYLIPHIRKIKEIAQTRNLPLLYHSDGNLVTILDELVDAGLNGLHPVEPKAMDIGELKKRYGKNLCFLGGVDLNYTLTRG